MKTMWPRSRRVSIIHIVCILLLMNQKVCQLESLVVTNSVRYAQPDPKSPSYLATTERIFKLPFVILPHHSNTEPYTSKFRRRSSSKQPMVRLSALDEEDRELLDNFYRQTKARDPFLDESLSNENLWDETISPNKVNAFTDRLEQQSLGAIHSNDGSWTIDPTLMTIDNDHRFSKMTQPAASKNLMSEYSPSFKLLTSYDPSQDDLAAHEGLGGSKMIGATLYSTDKSEKPRILSKSPSDAIMLHNEMLEKPPKDGVVRVRMYYHRAIHDDVKLYGNGPWKYWGHGWGVEFGYDPKEKNNKDAFYQRGYTIERAFGRDFCHDNKHCREEDPDFFKDPQAVGGYSKKHSEVLSHDKRSSLGAIIR